MVDVAAESGLKIECNSYCNKEYKGIHLCISGKGKESGVTVSASEQYGLTNLDITFSGTAMSVSLNDPESDYVIVSKAGIEKLFEHYISHKQSEDGNCTYNQAFLAGSTHEAEAWFKLLGVNTGYQRVKGMVERKREIKAYE